MSYVDGFVLTVPVKKLKAYRALAQKASKIFMKHGALQYFECVGDDLAVPFGGVPFPKIAGTKKGEAVIFSFIIYKNKAQRDRVNKKIMNDPKMQEMCDPNNMPFDMKRMSYGGFKTIVEA